MGDFNAKLGCRKEESEDKMGGYGYGDRNGRGEMLMAYLEEQKLYAMNSFFKKKPQRKWTWTAPNGETKNEIDYVLTKTKEIVKDVTVLNNFSTGSDHRLVRTKIAINLKMERYLKIKRRNPIKIDTRKLSENGEKYRNLLETTLCPRIQESLTINEMNNIITDKMMKAGGGKE